MPTLRIHGPAQLTLDDGRALALSAREAALLAWLHLQGPTARARLAGLLWPLGDDARARTNLRQTLARLRRAAGEVLAEDDGVLRLAAALTLDAADGELLAGLHFDDAPELEEWLAARRDDARRGRQRERLADAQACLADGDLDGALALADAQLADEPESEQAWRLRMEICYLRGDRAAAIAAWDACREALRRAFGVSPSAQTNELGRLILASAAPSSAATPVLPAALRRPPQLIGRAAALAAIDRALHLRHAVVVAGPGGIGKSRVLLQALAAHEPALLVAARAGDRVLPGASFARLLSAAIRRFAPVLDEATQRDLALLLHAGERGAPDLKSALEHRRVLASAARALRACAQRGLRVLAVDDLQFADDDSIGALRVTVGAWLADEDRGDAQGAVPLIAARDAELSEAGRALLAQLADSRRSARLDLGPLGAAEVRALLDELPIAAQAPQVDLDALAAALHAQVGGNPAFLLESLKSLWLDRFASWTPGQALPVPASLMESLRRRLQRLPEAALQVAQLAAVAQRDFSVALAAAALGRAPLALAPVFAELEAAQVFHGHAFSHDLVAEAVRASLPAALGAPLHQLVADHLIAQEGAAASIAHHLAAAGAAQAAAPWWLRAAEQARGRWQMLEAARSFEAAAQALTDGAAPSEAARAAALLAWRDAARCWSRGDRDAAAGRALDAADALARTPRERLLLTMARTAQQINARELELSVRSAQRLVDALGPHGGERDLLDGAELAEAARFACAAVPYGLPAERALALYEAVRAPVAAGGARALVELQAALGGVLHWAAQPLEADAVLTEAWRAPAAAGDASLRITIGNRLARVRSSLGQLAAALEVGEATLALAEQVQAGVGVVTDLMEILALMQVGRGQAAAALARIELMLKRLADDGAEPSPATCRDIANACLAAGRLDDAERWVARSPVALGAPGFALHDLTYLTTAARLKQARGESPAAEATQLAQLREKGLPVGPLLQLRAVLLRWRPPPPDEVRALLADLRARDMRGLLRCALNGAARAALERGDRKAAAEHAREALQLAAHADIWCEEPADVWWTAYEVLQACGHADEADAALNEGAAWVEAGSAQWTTAAEREAWREGNPVHRALLRAARPAGVG
jgi:DNA-binding SARP family transcriptional activator